VMTRIIRFSQKIGQLLLRYINQPNCQTKMQKGPFDGPFC
jgi:hypothetical protein